MLIGVFLGFLLENRLRNEAVACTIRDIRLKFFNKQIVELNGLTTHVLKKVPKCVVNDGRLRYAKHRKRYLMIKFLLK